MTQILKNKNYKDEEAYTILCNQFCFFGVKFSEIPFL